MLDLHGWGDLHTELHRLSKINAWDTMTGLIDDTMLNTFAVVGEPKEVGAEVRRRFGDIVDRFSFYAPYRLHPQACETMISAIGCRHRNRLAVSPIPVRARPMKSG